MILRNRANQLILPQTELSWYTCPRQHLIQCNGRPGIGGSREIYCQTCHKIYLKKQCKKTHHYVRKTTSYRKPEAVKRKISETMKRRAAEWRQAVGKI